MLTLANRLRIPDHVVCRKVGTDTVVLDMKSGVCFGLNRVGGRCFELLERESQLSVLVTRMFNEFDVSTEQIEADVLRLCEELIASGLLESA